MNHGNYNLNPEPYCIAKYEQLLGKVICYEYSPNGTYTLGFADRNLKPECWDCPQLTEATDMMMKDRRGHA